MKRLLSFAVLPLSLLGCCPDGASEESAPPPLTEEAHREKAITEMHDVLLADVKVMREAVTEIQRAAPTEDRGWDVERDAAAIAAMRAAWIRARTAYEHVEGALAPMFPDIDASIDARYDDFLSQLAPHGGDDDLFDGAGVTGMHAVERIVFADVTPPRVVAFERSLPGYVPARFPETADEARSFREALCQKLVDDARTLEEQWTPANIDAAIAFQGLIMLAAEQREKVKKAASNEEESRYAERTMADLRDNLDGTMAAYAAFQPWILSRPDGPAIDARIQAGFAALAAAYSTVEGAAIPAPPPTWSAEQPSPADLESPFGRLYVEVNRAVDPGVSGSLVAELRRAATMLGFEDFTVVP